MPADRDPDAEAWIFLAGGLLRSFADRLGGVLGRGRVRGDRPRAAPLALGRLTLDLTGRLRTARAGARTRAIPTAIATQSCRVRQAARAAAAAATSRISHSPRPPSSDGRDERGEDGDRDEVEEPHPEGRQVGAEREPRVARAERDRDHPRDRQPEASCDLPRRVVEVDRRGRRACRGSARRRARLPPTPGDQDRQAARERSRASP